MQNNNTNKLSNNSVCILKVMAVTCQIIQANTENKIRKRYPSMPVLPQPPSLIVPLTQHVPSRYTKISLRWIYKNNTIVISSLSRSMIRHNDVYVHTCYLTLTHLSVIKRVVLHQITILTHVHVMRRPIHCLQLHPL